MTFSVSLITIGKKRGASRLRYHKPHPNPRQMTVVPDWGGAHTEDGEHLHRTCKVQRNG